MNNECARNVSILVKYLLHSSFQVPENSNAIYELNIAKRHFPVEKCNRKYRWIYVTVPQSGAGEYISRFGEVENLRYFWRRKIDLQLKYFYWNKFSTFPLEKSIEWLAAAAGFKFGWISTSAANWLIGEVLQSRRRPQLGPSPGWKRLLALSHLRHY